jgi:chromosome segregation ATPase
MAELDTKVTLLERDHERFMVLFEKMDSNLDKITELTSSMKEMLAVQENRLDNNDDRYSNVEKRLEKHSDRLDALERWRWYLTGAIVIVGGALPSILSYILKSA